jgi:spermidine synthase
MQEFFSPKPEFFMSAEFATVTILSARARWTGADARPISARFFRNETMAKIFTERLHRGYAQTMELSGDPLAEEKSKYQRIRIFDTLANGRVLVLDDIVQLTTRDESAYAEMLTHLPLFEHGSAARVMIVGGGDFSIADEALKHRGVKEVVLVDIDGRVVELCREHFAAINAEAFADRRLTIEVADAFEYLGRAQSRGRFDLVVADRPDPVGPGKALFGETFYERVKNALAPGGFATFQTGVPFYQPKEISDALAELHASFPQYGLYLTVVPTYIGGYMALSGAGKSKRLGTVAGLKRARAAFARARLKTDYYNPEIHAAAFALPEWIKRLCG